MKLKFIFNFTQGVAAPLLGLSALVLTPPQWLHAQLATASTDGGAAQRLVSLVDYIGGDYRLAVKDGAVVAADEYAEQRRFAGETRAIARGLLPQSAADDPLLATLARVEVLVAATADPEAVAGACREAHDLAVSRFGLETRPLHRPSLQRARQLYVEACAICHGPHGDADTERARALDPQPASFRDSERLLDLAPYRVYNALTFGVPGTAMPSFEVFTQQERWDLAFYVFHLGHAGSGAAVPVGVALADLASRTDRQLLMRFSTDGSGAGARLAWARRQGPYVEPPASADLARTREMLREAMALFDSGRPAEADGRVLDAYLQGFEPVEPRLRVHDGATTRAVETTFQELRSELLRGDAVRARAGARRLDDLLQRLTEDTQPLLPFVAAALIYLREGLEAALLVGALLAGVARLGMPRAARFVHAGWLLALPAGVLTWWLMTRLLDWGAAQRELVEAVVALLAAAVLFWVSFWMISKAESRRWAAYLQGRLETSLSRGNLMLLTGLAFLAAYREAAETALFTQALLLEAKGLAAEVWSGATVGLLAVAAAAFGMSRTVMRLPMTNFFTISSLLLLGLAVSFAGSGIHELVSAGYLTPRPVAFPAVPWLGIHSDLTALLVQFTIVSVVGLAGLTTLRRSAVPASHERDRRDPD